MHMMKYFIPRDRITRAVRAEDRIGRIAKVRVRIITGFGDDFCCVAAGTVAVHPAEDVPFSFTKRRKKSRKILKRGNRSIAL